MNAQTEPKQTKPKQAKKPKAPKPKIPPTPTAYRMRTKLQALAARGINGEKAAAVEKLARLEAKYDFTILDPTETRDIFEGSFQPASNAEFVARLTVDDLNISNAVKWAIEHATGIRCSFRGDDLHAQATHQTAQKLGTIAQSVAASFTGLWSKMQTARGITQADRSTFYLGLYEGMMREERNGELLPTRPDVRLRKPRKKSVGHAAGIFLHPYSIALDLGRQLRMATLLPDLANELERKIKGEIET